jgi:4-hydroxy-tetrahydrodipicolinate synthase
MPRFGPVLTAMVTPFDDDGNVDLDGTATLAKWLVANGNDGLVVTGTTGEASTLTDEEQIDVWRAVRGAVDVPLIAGSGTNDTVHSCELTSRAADAGMDAVLLVTPYYNRPPQAGIEAHFRRVAAATDLPVMLYDIPIRTGRPIAPEVILRLVESVPNIWALKDALGDPSASARLIAAAPDGFELYSGDDAFTLPLLGAGAVGTISVAAHWAGNQVADFVGAFFKGDLERAREINATLIESYQFESGDLAPNPLPTKAMLRALGLPAGQCRLPMGDAPEGLEARALEVWRNLGNDAPA